jgi:ATP-dependent RNA helicase DDX23/PRP28
MFNLSNNTLIMDEFKVKFNQPKFLTREERQKQRESLPKPEIKSSIIPIRSRSPVAIEKTVKFSVPTPRFIDFQKYRSSFKFEWDDSDDTLTVGPITRLHPSVLKSKPSQKKAEKNLDLSSKPQSQMSSRDWRIFKENNYIETQNTEILPFRNWDESTIDNKIKKALRSLRYSHPTPIQMQGIPVSMTRQDVIGVSFTGSGKSMAYLIPVVQYCLSLPKLNFDTNRDGPYALILSPTRELALQLTEECEQLIKFTDLRVYCIIGGKNVETQRTELASGAEIIIATPGRLLELLSLQYLVFNQCFWIVVDEADKIFLLELDGIIQEIFSFFRPETWKTPNCTQGMNLITLQIYSATVDNQIEVYWRKYLRNPAIVRISDGFRKLIQKFEFVQSEEKRNKLKKILKQIEIPVLIFVNERVVADNLQNYLSNNWKVASLHGDKTQDMRESVMEKFQNNRLQVLITTDVFSRGINIKYLRYVINFDCPKNIIDYEHRIGRTGRMGQKGTAITFLTPEDIEIVPHLVLHLQKTKQKVPEELNRHLLEKIKITDIIE